MSDPSKISRDVKGLVADFRDELKLRDPWDREIDIQFKRIQRKYKELLFDFPFARQTHSVDQALWTDTSYALIALYRARIDPTRSSTTSNKNVVENRKILQKFLAFLAAEGAFWSGIALRLVREHGLREASKAMTALGMDVIEFENRESLNRRSASAGPGAGNIAEGRPALPSAPPPTPEHRTNKILTLFRTLIFLGDLARYREQYGTHPNRSNTESGRRPRGGRRGKDKAAGGAQEKRYAKAEAFYLQARLLLPDYGNPFNQLAIVYSYQRDLFGAALNYYRALCVSHPFPTAKDNLVRTLGKCLEADRELWRVRRANEREDGEKGNGKAGGGGEVEEPGDLESKFKQDVVLLHALWAGRSRPPKLTRHTHNVLASFASLAARRLLPAATLVHVLVLALGALWKVRMYREGEVHRPRGRPARGKGNGTRAEEASPETRVVTHILALCTVLLDLGAREIQEGIREAGDITRGASGSEDDPIPSERLAQRITGTFRRTLPALRIASKWIKSNVEYVQRHGPAETGPVHDSDPTMSEPTHPDPSSFWRAWAHFSTQLSHAFPLGSLPPVTVTLEEDVDMRGFAPLKRGTGAEGSGSETGVKEEVDAASVHPNEEQLMRIADLIVDAKFVVNVPESPVSLVDGGYVFDARKIVRGEGLEGGEGGKENGSDLEDELDGEEEEREEESDEDLEHPDDDRATVSTRTEDDPVRLAMDAVLSDDEEGEEEDDEEILYPQKQREGHFNVAILPPQGSTLPSSGPGLSAAWPPPPSFLSDSSVVFTSEPTTQLQPSSLSKSSGTTAQDLLDRVMSGATGSGAPSFLSGQSASGSGFVGSSPPLAGNNAPMRGPTPSFLGQSSALSYEPGLNNAFASLSPFPTQSPPFRSSSVGFGQGQGSPFAQSSPFMQERSPSFPGQPFSNQPSPFPNQRSPGSQFPPGSSSPFAPGDPAPSFFPSHTRVSSLSGAASIWTPAPQEVSRSPQLGMPSRTGSMRANSMSAGTGGALPLPSRRLSPRSSVWSPQEDARPQFGFGEIGRPRTYTTPTEVPQWR